MSLHARSTFQTLTLGQRVAQRAEEDEFERRVQQAADRNALRITRVEYDR